ncbi:cyclin-like protein [Periconia macrospinosa]|uniref:RNA polymerase II holoenzyme cyclin-like subunit n=1 Tax=Periconia macrospinosa TaxID=97972 RepID=A0A2V1EAK4_9PLEO|nr:cyclin-like protein [Periconia macrospinosa]
MKLTEDVIYRNSSQFRNWSFTPTQLAELRLKTNIQACERVKANVARQRAQRAAIALDGGGASASDSERGNTPGLENGNGNENGNSNGGTPMRLDKEVDCLTVAEEMRLVDFCCETTIDLAKFIGLPSDVTATAVQFLRRFYLYNSPMTYDAPVVSRTITFIACKTDNANPNLDDYVAKLGKVTRDQILAPEYLIVQALRYNFEVRHPFRGLKGAHLELGEIARGAYTPVAPDTRTPSDLQAAITALPLPTSGAITDKKTISIENRLNNAYGFAANILKRTAQLTDAYFLFTPSQIMLASLLLADEPLTTFYLSTKLPSDSPTYTKLLTTLRSCAILFSSHRSYTSSTLSPEEQKAVKDKDKAEISALRKKLKNCRDPDKMDLVKLNQAQKRDAENASGGGLEESKAKRRKIAREKAEKEADDFWGPELGKK